MNTKKTLFLAAKILAVLLCAGAGSAQSPSGPPRPGPEHEKLAYFAGKWEFEVDMKPSSFGPGGKVAYTQTCEWFDGNFALVCRTDRNQQTNAVKILSIMSWDPAAKTYVYFETNTLGRNLFSRGTVEGDTWTWNNEINLNGKPVAFRFTLKQVSPDVCTYKVEMAGNDNTMKLMMDGKQTRLR